MKSPSMPENIWRKRKLIQPESGYIPALRVTFFYIIFSGLWILLSDQLLVSFVSEPTILTKLQTYKGEFFVVTSAALIYFLLSKEIRRRDTIERSWRQSEQKYRQLVEQASDGIFISDEAGHYVDVNPSGCKLLGYECDELIGMSFSDLLPDDELKRNPLRLTELKKGRQLLIERKMLRKDGSPVFVEISAKALDDGYLQGIVRDITPRIDAEARMRKWADIFEHTRMGIAISDPVSNRLDLVNPAYAEMHGYTVSELSGKSVDRLYTPEFQSAMRENLLQANQKGHHIFETTHVRKDGTQFPVLIDSTAVSGSDGEKLYIIASVQDISERKKTEQRIQRQLERLNALRKIDLAISARLRLPETLNVLISQLIDRVQVDVVQVYLVEEHNECLRLMAGYGIDVSDTELPIPISEKAYARQIIDERRPLTIEGITPAALTFNWFEQVQGNLVYHGNPLIIQSKVIGILDTYHEPPCRHDQELFEFLEALAGQAAIAIDNANLYEDLQRTSRQLAEAYDATLEGWSRALELRDQETEGHSHRVTQLTVKLARFMGLPDERLVDIRRGTLLHDIGKMGVPDSILLKPGPLTTAEWQTMRMHPEYAYRMLRSVDYLRPALDIPYCHHEWWNGTGYPRGLVGEEIPLAARIFAVVDVWDALRSDRSYRSAWSDSEVRKYIIEKSGIQFDPVVVKRFLEIISDEKETKG